MPIQILQPEFIRPIYIGTWAGKPSAAGNAGKEIVITDWNRSRWYSDGTYWRPVGGEQVVHNQSLLIATASSTTLQVVASVPGWQMPSDLVMPALSISTFFSCIVTSASAAQQRQIYVGVADAEGVCLRHQYTANNSLYQGQGISWLTPDMQLLIAPLINGGQSQVGNGGGDATISQMLASPIRMYYKGGSTDGSESFQIPNFRLSVRG